MRVLLLLFNVVFAHSLLRGNDLRDRLRRQIQRDVVKCFPFRGKYETGCDFVHNMCELSSYQDDPANPSWCTKYASDVVGLWLNCEKEVRTNSSVSGLDVRGNPLPPHLQVNGTDFGPNFVKCFSDHVKEPDCNGICAQHDGACQVLCPPMGSCLGLCRGTTGPRGSAIKARYDIQDCMDDCLLTQPTPKPPTATWPNTTTAAYPPETADHQEAIALQREYLANLEAQFEVEAEKLANATRARDALRDQLKAIIKEALYGVAPAAPVADVATTLAPVVATTAAPAAVVTPAPIVGTPADAIASSPMLASEMAVKQQMADVAEETQSVYQETLKLEAELADLRAQLGLPVIS